jgi:hypothetical protein
LDDPLVDGFNVGIAVNGVELIPAGVVVQDGLGLFSVYVEPLPDDGFRIIGPTAQEQSADNFLFGYDQVDDNVHRASLAVQQLIQRLGLGNCSGEAVQDTAVLVLRGRKRLLNESRYQLVRHQKTVFYVVTHLGAQRRPFPNGLSKHLPGGEMGDTEAA